MKVQPLVHCEVLLPNLVPQRGHILSFNILLAAASVRERERKRQRERERERGERRERAWLWSRGGTPRSAPQTSVGSWNRADRETEAAPSPPKHVVRNA